MAVAICALLSGARCFNSIGEWASCLNQEMLKRLARLSGRQGCWYNERLEKFVPPSEKTLRLTLKRVDGDEVDDLLGQWLLSQSQARAAAVDGKTLRGSSVADGKPVHLVSAFLQREKIVIGQRQVDKKKQRNYCIQAPFGTDRPERQGRRRRCYAHTN
ncbi:MAG TPA: hypothetical protein DEH07_05160 [Desulfotomaculum sp.]|nr:hypothetical protein [Desulfotomaculum sp.]